MNEEAITVTSLSTNFREWYSLWNKGANFHALNMGMCIPFALGLSLAFPRRKVIALESDGSLLLDTSTLVTLAEANPSNLVVLVFDNQSFGIRMGPTATAGRANLALMAEGAGIKEVEALNFLS
jgi:thiamine pyrophosphate-dependent acetolactate synthase large subunit-like protein